MEKVTLEGPVTVLPTADYQALVQRLEALESAIKELQSLLGAASESQSLRESKTVYEVDVSGEEEEGVWVPAKVLNASGLTAKELLIELAVHLFEQDLISLGVAKSLAGMHTAQFMRLLGSRDIPMHYGVKELEEDVATMKKTGML